MRPIRLSQAVDIDQVHLPSKLGQQRWEHIFLVTPNQPIPPRRFSTCRKQFETALSVGCTLVHGLDSLKWQRDSHWALSLALNVLAFPDKFGHRVSLSSRSIKIFFQRLLEYVLVRPSLSRPQRA
jgi:hypothetical protein